MPELQITLNVQLQTYKCPPQALVRVLGNQMVVWGGIGLGVRTSNPGRNQLVNFVMIPNMHQQSVQ